MANHKSALKRARQNVRRRVRNRSHRSALRTQIKKFHKAVTDGDLDSARGLLNPTLSLIDRSVQHGALRENAAARSKSRLTRLLNRTAAT